MAALVPNTRLCIISIVCSISKNSRSNGSLRDEDEDEADDDDDEDEDDDDDDEHDEDDDDDDDDDDDEDDDEMISEPVHDPSKRCVAQLAHTLCTSPSMPLVRGVLKGVRNEGEERHWGSGVRGCTHKLHLQRSGFQIPTRSLMMRPAP